MVEVSGVSKSFQPRKASEVVALSDVSFSVEPGTVHALLGMNGAGKTTMMRAICTIIRPDRGSITVNGFDTIRNSEDVRRSIGFLSNSSALYGRCSPVELLRFFAKLYDVPAQTANERIAELVETLQMQSFQDRLCDQLSTGQKQRVTIARAVLHRPPLVILDEPTAGLDVLSAQTVLEFVEHLRANGTTIIYSTHIMPEVERIADRITLIHQGKKCADGTLQELTTESGANTLEQALLSLIGHTKSF